VQLHQNVIGSFSLTPNFLKLQIYMSRSQSRSNVTKI